MKMTYTSYTPPCLERPRLRKSEYKHNDVLIHRLKDVRLHCSYKSHSKSRVCIQN